jgi:hypothetical protein
MYDTRWPRPGPAMAAVAALVGLVAGTILGLSSPGSAPRAQASDSVETTAGATTTTLPEVFHTVVLGSYNDRDNADRRLQEVRDQGVRDAAILDQQDWNLATRYAVYSGQFATPDQARAHLQELAGLGILERQRFYKKVTRRS